MTEYNPFLCSRPQRGRGGVFLEPPSHALLVTPILLFQDFKKPSSMESISRIMCKAAAMDCILELEAKFQEEVCEIVLWVENEAIVSDF